MRHPVLICVLAALALAASPPPQEPAPKQQLRLVSTVWPPFTDVAGRPRRASELVHEALRRAGVTAETAIVADDRLIPSISDGTYQGSGALWYSAEREKFLLYSEPYMETRLLLVGRKGSDVSAKSLADLAGKRVALVKTWAYGPAVDEAARKGTIFVYGESMEDNLRGVLDGKADYTIIDDLVIRYLLEQYKDDARSRLDVGTTALVLRPLHFGLRRDVPGAKEIMERFNEQIVTMIFDGTYNRVLNLAWIEADVDRDGQTELVAAGVRAGEAPPTDAYSVATTSSEPQAQGTQAPPKKLRFVVGGEVYQDWAAVPQQYKVPHTATGSVLDDPATVEPIFKFKF
jgi:ABC-type amino acid transport substrate-binding protein